MSMCLYVKSGEARELGRMVADPDQLVASVLPRGSDLAQSARALSEGPFSAEALERQVDAMQRASRNQGWSGWIMGHLLARQMRREHAKVRADLARLQRSGDGAAPGGTPPLDLHKSWHMLHYLFTGTAWDGRAPENTLLAGGREIGEDLGYGPARLVGASETAAFAAFLSSLSLDDLGRRVDLRAMARLEIYCASDGDDDAAEIHEDLDHYFPLLKDYVAAAATRGHGMAIWMS